MIDLNAPVQTVLGVDLAADSEDPLLLHVMPAPPQVALVEGSPDLQLLRFVQDGALTGGHLRLSVDLRHEPELLDEVVAELNRDPARAARPFRIAPAAVSRAAAQLVFLGQEPNGQGGLTPMLSRPYADAIGQLPAPHTASFSVELTPAGVQILEAALRSAGAPIAVVVRLDVEGLWPAQRVVARVDWGRVYDHLSTHLKQGWLLGVDDIARVVEQLREDRSIQISAVQSLSPEDGGSPAELDAALAWIQRELVERFCEPVLPLARTPAHASLGTMGEIFGVGTSFAAKALTQVERAVATVDFQVARVLTRNYTVQSHLADVLMGSPMDDHIADAGLDHPFFQRFALRVRAAQPLAELHLAEVVGELAYGSAHLPVRLVPDAPEATVDCWADASADRSWTFSATARFADDAPLGGGSQLLPSLTGRTRELPLDLAQLLGLAAITLDQPPDARVLFSTATVRHWRGAEQRAERDLTLTPDARTAVAWFADREPGDRLDATARHLLADGRQLTGPTVDVDSTQVVLPPPIPAHLSVQLIAADDWAAAGVTLTAVALQRVAADQDAARTLTVLLDRPGAVAEASLDLPDPTDRRYRYRCTRTTSTGEIADGWLTTDLPVLLVGGAGGELLVVDVTPVGPELATAGITLIEVDLLYVDAVHQIRDQQTEVIRAVADRPRWQVRLADSSRRGYEYRITMHRTSGAVTVGDWTPATDRLLVVPVV